MARRRTRPRADEKPPAAPAGESRWFTAVKQASVVVGLVSAVVGLLLIFVPQIRRDDAPATPPPEQFASVSSIAIDPDTTQGQFLERAERSKLGFTPAQLKRKGAYVAVNIEIVGYRGTTLPVQREVVDAVTGDEVGQERSETITPPANRVASPWPDWVPLRPGKGRYVVVIKLLDERRSRAIACAQSTPFGGAGGLVDGKQLALCPAGMTAG